MLCFEKYSRHAAGVKSTNNNGFSATRPREKNEKNTKCNVLNMVRRTSDINIPVVARTHSRCPFFVRPSTWTQPFCILIAPTPHERTTQDRLTCTSCTPDSLRINMLEHSMRKEIAVAASTPNACCSLQQLIKRKKMRHSHDGRSWSKKVVWVAQKTRGCSSKDQCQNSGDELPVAVIVVVDLTLTHCYNAVRGRRTGSNNSGAEDYLIRRKNEKNTRSDKYTQ